VTDYGKGEAIVRASIDAWNSDDWERDLRSIWDPDGVIVLPEGWPEAGTFVGWDAMREQWGRIKDSWREEQVDLISAEPAGTGVLAEVRWKLRGEASGAPLDVQAWILCELDGDRLSKMTYFLDRETANAAVEAMG
jgi:ketosteroid isomerase-like protein